MAARSSQEYKVESSAVLEKSLSGKNPTLIHKTPLSDFHLIVITPPQHKHALTTLSFSFSHLEQREKKRAANDQTTDERIRRLFLPCTVFDRDSDRL